MIVKICGITTVEDARHSLGCGADWIGLNLVAGPRRIDLSVAISLAAQLPDPSRAVALTPSPHQEESRGEGEGSRASADFAALYSAGIRRLQLYGAVTPRLMADLHERGFETILVHYLADETSLEALDEFLARCGDYRPDHVLFDAPPAQARGSSSSAETTVAARPPLGGTGHRANWVALSAAHAAGRYAAWPPILLAGGLTAQNVGEAIRATHPAGVDVSSGVEAAPGRKDPHKVAAFIRAARGQPTP